MGHRLRVTPPPFIHYETDFKVNLEFQIYRCTLALRQIGALSACKYLHKIKTSHGLKITNCMKIRTGRNGPFLGAKNIALKDNQ